MITMQEELFTDCYQETIPLVAKHYEEIALDQDKVPLDVDFGGYLALQCMGKLFVLTIRDDRKLIGYHSVIVSNSLHNKSTIFGDTDIFYVSPEYRGGRLGIKMFLTTEKLLKPKGVQKVIVQHKLHVHPYIGKILEHIGYRKIEHVYAKTI